MIDRLVRKLDRVLGLVGKEFRQLLRDPRMARVIFVAPILQLVIFGYAVSTDIWATRVAVLDRDETAESRGLVDTIGASGYFEVSERPRRSRELVDALDRGDVVVGIEIPPGFGAALASGASDGARVQVLIDGTSSNTASVAQGYLERIIASYGTRSLGVAPPATVDLRDRALYNPDLASRNYNVPAVVGALILLICLLLTSLAVVREREIGTLEQLQVSPLTPGELIVGKTIPFAIVGLLDLVLVVAIALLWFDVPFRGGFLTLFVASVLYILSGLGLGLLISSVSNTQQEAFMASFLVFMPAILLSGFMFPVSSMPAVFRWITLVNPVRHYIEIVRATFLKGVGIRVMWHQFAALAAIGATLLFVAARRFRRAA